MWGNWTYLTLILAWAGPVIIFQWLLGVDLLIRRWKVLIPGILIPTLYLTMADSFALGSGTWTISSQQSLNLFLPIIHVPIEEALFFLFTNMLIVQAMILLLDRSRMQKRVSRLVAILKRGKGIMAEEDLQ